MTLAVATEPTVAAASVFYPSRKAITTSHIPTVADGGPQYILACAFDDGHDMPLTAYKRVEAPSSDLQTNPGYPRSLDGQWWKLSTTTGELHVEQFGGRATLDYMSTAYDTSAVLPHIYKFVEIYPGYRVGWYNTGGTIVYGFGYYYHSDTIEPPLSVALKGQGAAFGNEPSRTTLVFAPGKRAGRFNYISSFDPSVSKISAMGSTIDNLTVLSLGGGVSAGTGPEPVPNCTSAFECAAGVRMGRVTIIGFAGHGVAVNADVNSIGNANCFNLEYIRVVNCGGSGLYTRGGDANAGTCIGLNTMQVGRYGFEEESFLGNTYVAGHSAAAGMGAFCINAANPCTTVVGQYTESDSPGAIFSGPHVLVGGLHGAGFRPASAGATRGRILTGYTQSGGRVLPLTLSDPSYDSFEYSHMDGYATIHKITDKVGGYYPAEFQFLGPKGAGWRYANYDPSLSYHMTLGDPAGPKMGRSAAIPALSHVYNKGLWIGNRFRGSRATPPTAADGPHAEGDMYDKEGGGVLGKAGSQYTLAGWRCTVAGTPGTWVERRELTGT